MEHRNSLAQASEIVQGIGPNSALVVWGMSLLMLQKHFEPPSIRSLMKEKKLTFHN